MLCADFEQHFGPEIEKESTAAYCTFLGSCCACSEPSNLNFLLVDKRFLRIQMENFPSK